MTFFKQSNSHHMCYTYFKQVNTWSNSKYFENWTSPLRIWENFEGDFVDTFKRQNPRYPPTGPYKV